MVAALQSLLLSTLFFKDMSADTRTKILGISAYYHDSAAALVVDGDIIAAAQEERFTRKKHDSTFPRNAISYVLDEAGLLVSDLDAIVFYDKPLITFERILETYHAFAPKGVSSFVTSMPVWVKEKLFTKSIILKELEAIEGKKFNKKPKLLFTEHHLSHAASAFYPSPFKKAAILTVDGVGEWATTTIGIGDGNSIKILKEIRFPHSLGLLYSAFTYYCGFRVNSGEYKLMGLAPYGQKGGVRMKEYKEKIYTKLLNLQNDGSFFLNMDYFGFATGLTMSKDKKWHDLFGIPRRLPESELRSEYMDMALAIQEVTEEVLVALVKTARKLTHCDNLVMAGGVALNCVANARIEKEGIFKHMWIQPAADDAGGALGAAYAGYYIGLGRAREITNPESDDMKSVYLGPQFSEKEILNTIKRCAAPFVQYDNEEALCEDVAELLAAGNVIGWFQGRMEWGPRALGNRSILGDPRNPAMQKKLNLKIKYREGFRPFAPSVLEEDLGMYFEMRHSSPYMLFTTPVKKERRVTHNTTHTDIYERLYSPRSDIPTVTHLDYSARIQTVSKKTNEQYWKLINAFKEKTGCSVVVNTSFNVRGEPIVCTPLDAYLCFMNTEMDYLVMGTILFDKKSQPQ